MRSRLRRAYENLGPVKFVLLCLRMALKPLLFRDGRIIYSQFGEEVLAVLHLDPRAEGFYVDLGCNQPRSLSATYWFYERGWRGIVIDGNNAFAPSFRKLRPRDKFVNAIVSDSTEAVEFVTFADDKISSIERDHIANFEKRVLVTNRHLVTPRTLTSILAEQNCPPRFELLNVDVEGHDLEALRSLDFDRFSPKVILVEIHDFWCQNAQQIPLVGLLRGYGYEIFGYTGYTALFVRSHRT